MQVHPGEQHVVPRFIVGNSLTLFLAYQNAEDGFPTAYEGFLGLSLRTKGTMVASQSGGKDGVFAAMHATKTDERWRGIRYLKVRYQASPKCSGRGQSGVVRSPCSCQALQIPPSYPPDLSRGTPFSWQQEYGDKRISGAAQDEEGINFGFGIAR